MNFSQQIRITDDMYASSGQRLANYFIDLIIQYILITILLVIAMISTESATENGEPGILLTYGIGFSVSIVYYCFFEMMFSKSIGKFITKTKVVTIDGEKPDGQTIFIRTICRIIPFDALSFLGSRGWHDSLSKTAVVRTDVFDEGVALQSSFDEIGNTQNHS